MKIEAVDGVGVWRGSQPETGVDIADVRRFFRTVINLEMRSEDWNEAEKLNSVAVREFPISFWEIYVAGMKDGKLKAIVDVIEASNKPVLVHCKHGEDRTGLVIGAYRVIVNHWCRRAAWQEMLDHGYRNWLNFGLNRTWNDFWKMG